jgi:hypothetical protein
MIDSCDCCDDDERDTATRPTRRSRMVWPDDLDAALRCQGCGARVAWGRAPITPDGFTCPICTFFRPRRRARAALRRRVAERDSWICHRCLLPTDRNAAWPHPLAAVADHYPVAASEGGPPIMANLRIAHSLCNGSSQVWARETHNRSLNLYGPDSAFTAATNAPRRKIEITPDQHAVLQVILQTAATSGGLPLTPPRPSLTDPPSAAEWLTPAQDHSSTT